MERDDEPAHPAHLGAGDRVDVLPEDRVVLLVDADRILDRPSDTLRVVGDGVDVGDLAEAIAAELERHGHEAEAPLADVEGRAAVVVCRRVAVRHDHLREREPMGDGPDTAAVLVADRVEDEPFPVVEADAERPVLPREQVALERE